jgi:hypothetical protein
MTERGADFGSVLGVVTGVDQRAQGVGDLGGPVLTGQGLCVVK